MLFSAERIGDGENKAAGRWRLNSGSEMILNIPALCKTPIRAVIEISSAKFAHGQDRIISLYDHDDQRVVGFWDKGAFSNVIEADLHLIEPKNEAEASALKEAVIVNAMTRSGVPIQVSVGAEPGENGEWVHIPPGDKIVCNGREYCGDGDLPLYVLKNGEVYEASIVTFGADSVTGRIAARLNLPVVKVETPMGDKLKVLLGKYPEKHHGLVARCVAEDMDEAVINDKIHAAELADKDAEIAKLKAALAAKKVESEAEAEAEAEADDYGVNEKEKEEEREHTKKIGGKPGKAKAKAKSADRGVVFGEHGESEGEAPKTLSDAMKVMIEAGAKERGFALRAAALSKYPKVERI